MAMSETRVLESLDMSELDKILVTTLIQLLKVRIPPLLLFLFNEFVDMFKNLCFITKIS